MMDEVQAKVLVIDDEPDMREMLALNLTKQGFDVTTAESGMAAVEQVKKQKYDLAITDLKMPGMDGVETIDALKAIDPDLQIIVGTGYATVDTAVACMKKGAYDYIQKPYNLKELKILVEKALDRSHLEGVVTLYEASRILLETLDESNLIPMVLNMATRTMGAEKAVLGLSQGERKERSLYCSGESTVVVESLFNDLVKELEVRESPYLISSKSNEDKLLQGQFGSALVYSLRRRDQDLGTLALFRNQDQLPFSQSELKRGAILAAELSLSLENARLYGNLAQKVQELLQTQEKLVQSEKLAMVGKFASCIAHEINNPLAVVQMNLAQLLDDSTDIGSLWVAAKSSVDHLLRTEDSKEKDSGGSAFGISNKSDEFLDNRVQEIASMIDESLQAVQRIADLVVGFERMSPPLNDPQQETVDLCKFVKTCVDEFTSLRSTQVCPVLLGESGPLYTRLACQDVKVALLNILSFLNNVEQNSDSKESIPIRIQVEKSPKDLWLKIVDPCLRLSDEERKNIFDPAVRSNIQESRTMRLDVRMALAYQILARNHIELTVQEAVSGGTCFQLRFCSETKKEESNDRQHFDS